MLAIENERLKKIQSLCKELDKMCATIDMNHRYFIWIISILSVLSQKIIKTTKHFLPFICWTRVHSSMQRPRRCLLPNQSYENFVVFKAVVRKR